MKDVLQIHNQICPLSKPSMLQLSYDGIQEAKSSLVSLDTFSVAFNKCRNIYPIRLIKPINKFKVDEQNQLAMVLQDINANDIGIYSASMDKPKRTVAYCIMSHAAYYPCEYCECKAHVLHSENQDNENTQRAKKTQLVWPYETRKGKLRTINSIRDIADRIDENGGPLHRDEAKGITGRSLFLDQPRFNLICDCPAEYMHSTCLGLVKRVVELTFKVGETRERITKRKLSDPHLFNLYISVVQVPRECGRRCRNLDFSVYKAQEFRNIVLFMFPLVIKCIEPKFTDEIKLWYYLAYMVRACVLPNSEFRTLPNRLVSNACDNFYRLFEKLYGPKNCSYSVHVVPSHLLLIRGNQPLTFKSAFKFESFFAEMKQMYVPGTISTTKQVLQNCYMKRSLEHHKCEKTIFYDCKKKPVEGKPFLPGLENNYMIYVTDENNFHHFYQIIDRDPDNSDLFICIKQGKFPFKTPLITNLDWGQVGVYKLGPTSEEEHCLIAQHEISGKVMKVDNLLITFPLNVLREN